MCYAFGLETSPKNTNPNGKICGNPVFIFCERCFKIVWLNHLMNEVIFEIMLIDINILGR